MGFSGVADLRSEIAAGKIVRVPFSKLAASGTGSAGVFMSLWDSSSGSAGLNGDITGGMSAPPAGSATPGAGGRTCTDLAGSIFFRNESPDTKHLSKFSIACNVPVTLILLDRLADVGTFSLTSATTYDVQTAAIPRYNAEHTHTRVWVELTAATTGTVPVVSANVTLTNGSTAQTTQQTTLGTNNARVCYPLGSVSGSTGVRLIETFTVHTASGGSAACNLVIAKELASIHLPGGGVHVDLDYFFSEGLPVRILDGASLWCVVYAWGNNTPAMVGEFEVPYG